MRRFAVLVAALALGGAACLGASSASTPRHARHTIGGPRRLRWTVAYAVGDGARTRARAPRCPAGARCRVVLDRRVTYGDGTHAWMTLARRTLTCPPGRGDYPDPARTCRALAQLRAALRVKVTVTCGCPAAIAPPGRATTTLGGRRLTVPLDFCTYCGRGGGARARSTTSDLLYLQLQPRG